MFISTKKNIFPFKQGDEDSVQVRRERALQEGVEARLRSSGHGEDREDHDQDEDSWIEERLQDEVDESPGRQS